MQVGTKVGQSPGTNRAGLPQSERPKREALYIRRNPLRDVGRIQWAGYSRLVHTNRTSVLWCLPGTSTFEQVDDGADK